MCNTKDIVRWARKRRREWNQHMSRMTTARLRITIHKEQDQIPQNDGEIGGNQHSKNYHSITGYKQALCF